MDGEGSGSNYAESFEGGKTRVLMHRSGSVEVQQFPFRESDDDGDDIIGSRAAESVQDGGGSVGSRASRGAQHGQGAALSTAELYSRSHPPAQHNTPTLQ